MSYKSNYLFAKTIFAKLIEKSGFYVTRNPDPKFFPMFVEKIHDQIIRNSKGIIHAGAHIGQESQHYFDLNKRVIWIEGNPEIFEILSKNIKKFENQMALLALLGAENKTEVEFNIASNLGMSSSLFEFSDDSGFHRLQMLRKIKLPMVTLNTLIEEKNLIGFDHLILDLQGAELLALEGLGERIRLFNSLYVEVSTREVYDGGVMYPEIASYLRKFNFVPLWEPNFNAHENLIFIRKH